MLGHYLPGYRAGGPVRALANLVEVCGDEIGAYILTADRDYGSGTPYPGVTPGVWHQVGKAQVMYLSPDQMALRPWAKLLNQIDYDRICLNSFLSPQTRQTLLLRRLRAIPGRPVVLAPRGELSPGALGLSRGKKRAYIAIALRLGLYDGLVWHATSALERSEILMALEPFISDLSSRLIVASDLILPGSVGRSPGDGAAKHARSARVVFLSRVARMKNLDFALASLHGLDEEVTFDIFGPMEDQRYWEECEEITRQLPHNIHVSYRGEVAPDQVARVLAGYHLFFLPTRGENFGYAIVEAMAAGCPLLISDQTPWRGLEEKGIGWDIPLAEPERFRQVLRRVVAMDQTELSAWSTRASRFGAKLVQQQAQVHLQAYRQLFGVARRG